MDIFITSIKGNALEINPSNPAQPGFLPNAVKLPTDIKPGDLVTLRAVKESFDGTTGKTSYKAAEHSLTVTRVYRSGNHFRVTAERGQYGNGYAQFDAIHSAFFKE